MDLWFYIDNKTISTDPNLHKKLHQYCFMRYEADQDAWFCSYEYKDWNFQGFLSVCRRYKITLDILWLKAREGRLRDLIRYIDEYKQSFLTDNVIKRDTPFFTHTSGV